MRRREAVGSLDADAADLLGLGWAVAVKAILKGNPGDVLHNNARQPIMLLDAMDGDDMLVGDGGSGLGLAGKALPGRSAGGQFRGHYLDRDDAVQLRIERLVNDTHAAPTDDLADLVVAEMRWCCLHR